MFFDVFMIIIITLLVVAALTLIETYGRDERPPAPMTKVGIHPPGKVIQFTKKRR